MNFKRIIGLLFAGAILASCSTNSDLASNSPIKKRRYTKGFQIDFKKKNKAQNTTHLAQVQTKPSKELAKPESHQISGLEPIASSKTEMSTITSPEKSFDSNPSMQNTAPVTEQIHLEPEEYTTNKERKRELKDAFKRYDNLNHNPVAVSGDPQWLYFVLAIIIPPLAIGLLYGITVEFWISLVLTLLFWLPGAIYSIIMTLKYYGAI